MVPNCRLPCPTVVRSIAETAALRRYMSLATRTNAVAARGSSHPNDTTLSLSLSLPLTISLCVGSLSRSSCSLVVPFWTTSKEMNRQLLARATEGTAAPTPGYLYKDLAQAASSNPSASHDMAMYLTQRLQSKSNPNIKYKCLKVMTKLCEEVPRNQFRRAISQHPASVSAIKECLQFRGPIDPVMGDEPNLKVRNAAQEALDAVYREATTSEMVMTANYGASPYGGQPAAGGAYSGGGGGHGGGRMEGIGNPRYSDPRLDPRYNPNNPPVTVQEAVREAGEIVLGMIKDPLARNAEVVPPVVRQGHSGNLPGYGNNYNNNRSSQQVRSNFVCVCVIGECIFCNGYVPREPLYTVLSLHLLVYHPHPHNSTVVPLRDRLN